MVQPFLCATAYQRGITSKVVIRGIQAKVGIGNSGSRHVNAVDYLLKDKRGVVVGVDVENGERGMREKKSKTHCLFN